MSERWDILDDEPSDWFYKFDVYYRPLGPGRSLSSAYREYYKDQYGKYPDSKHVGAGTGWSDAAKKWDWESRAIAWDVHVRRERIKTEQEAEAAMSKRHMDAAQALQALALETLVQQGIKDVNTALRAWNQAVDQERKARGMPEHIVKIGEMTDDELKAAIERKLRTLGTAIASGANDKEGTGDIVRDAGDGGQPADSGNDGDTEVSGSS